MFAVRNNRLLIVLLIFIGSISLPAVAVRADTTPTTQPDVLSTLRKGHPRLFALDDDITRVREQIAANPTAKAWFAQLKASADKMLTEPTATRVMIGKRLLGVSRDVLTRTSTLGGMYRLTGDKRYADRAREEMLAAANFTDWNPSHFLDVAEMTNAMAIGYDWLFDTLSTQDRKTIRTAIIEKGLKPGLEVYTSGKGFPKTTNNWNQVCNGGLTVGALAIADEEPELARQIILSAKESLPRAMAEFADGGCIEGPSYWGYATRYIVYYASAMQTALGDLEILRSPGLEKTGLFRIQSVGPLGRTFNFADGGENAGGAPHMFYFARAYDMPVHAAHERMRTGQRGKYLDIFHLLWFNPDGTEEDVKKLPTVTVFGRINAAFMRSDWTSPDAAFAGFKGGYNGASHANLDLGTFVYDADGVRWAIELGPDDYNLPGYFGKNRWTYYRLRTEGQNTLTLDGQNQNIKGKSPITSYSGTGERKYVIADLSNGYADQAARVIRGVALIGKELVVQDEIEADEPVELIWQMHTDAKIEIQDGGRIAVLNQDGKTLTARIVAGDNARFETAAADPPPSVAAVPPMRPGVIPRHSQKLVVRVPEKLKKYLLAVSLSPQSQAFVERPIQPLKDWSVSP